MSDDTLHHVTASDRTLRTIKWALSVAGQSSNPDDRANCRYVGGIVEEWVKTANEEGFRAEVSEHEVPAVVLGVLAVLAHEAAREREDAGVEFRGVTEVVIDILGLSQDDKVEIGRKIGVAPAAIDAWLGRAPEGIVGVTILVEPDPNVESRLEEFEIRQQEDDEGEFTDKLDLELIHDPCGEHLCDVEHDDTLRVLLSVARSHTCPHPDTIAHEASEENS